MHITQPTLSRQLSRMEEEVGVKLFERGSRKITLTNEGILLRRRAEEILQLVDKTEKELVEQDEQVEGKISIVSTILGRLLLSYLLGITLDMGVIGIAIAMVCDWSIRAVVFLWRQKSGKWKTFQVI